MQDESPFRNELRLRTVMTQIVPIFNRGESYFLHSIDVRSRLPSNQELTWFEEPVRIRRGPLEILEIADKFFSTNDQGGNCIPSFQGLEGKHSR